MNSPCRNDIISRPAKAGLVMEQAGFTLLEVLISISILVFISFGIYQATTNTFRLRDVLMNEGDFYNGIRMASSVVQRDVALIYSPALILPPKPRLPDGTLP